MFVSRPTVLRISNVTFTSFRVDWNPVPERFILGYRIFVQNTSLNETHSWNKTYADITGLRSNTEYTISVLPVHGLTDGGHLAASAAKIIVTTMRELGKFLLDLEFPQCVRISSLTTCKSKIFKVSQMSEIKVPGAASRDYHRS